MYKSNLILLLYFALLAPLSAQSHLVFSVIDSRNGLSDNQIRNITQLTDGRMLIKTQGLTNIFDGTNFTQLHLRSKSSVSLSGYFGFHNSYVDGNWIWMKNFNELTLIDSNQDAFVSRPDSVLRELGLPDNPADIILDNNRNYWIKTATDQLMFRKAEDKTIRLFQSRVSYPEGTKNELYDISVVREDVFLIYSNGLMICCDLKSGKVKYKTNSLKPEDQNTYNRTLTVVQRGDNLYMLRNNNWGIMQSFDTKKRIWTTTLKTDYWLNTISIDRNKTIWVSCKEGIWCIDESLQHKELIRTFRLVDGTDVTTEASTLYNDPQGGFWVGTYNHGLLYFHADRFKFRNLGLHYFHNNGMDLVINSFAELEQGRFLVASNKGIFIYDSDRNSVQPAPGELGKINCFQLQEKGQCFLLMTSIGYYSLKKDLSSFRYLSQPELQFGVVQDASSFLFFDYNREWGVLNLSDNARRYLGKPSQPAPIQWIEKLIWLDKQVLLGISNQGLFSFNVKSQTYDFSYEKWMNPIHSRGTDLLLDSRGLIWFGTMDGLTICDRKEKTMRTFFVEDGLVNNSIKAITEDLDKNVWISTSGGLSRITVNNRAGEMNLQIANFNRFDGVIENEFNEKSIYVSRNGILLIGGINGFNVTNLRKPWMLEQLQKPLFTSFQLFGKVLKPDVSYRGHRILNRVISATDTINLTYNQNFFSLGFSALNYVNPSQTYFRYKLEGIDEEWREIASVDGTGTATYTKMVPGTYRFYVNSANNSKKWSSETALITIIIRPPFWKTIYAFMLYLVLFSYAIYSALSYYRRRTHQKLELRNVEKLNQLKFNFFTNVSHEFRTPLTLIITPLESVLKEVKGSNLENILRPIFRHAQELLNLVNQLLDFRRLEVSGEKLNLTFGDFAEFVMQSKEGFDELAKINRIAFDMVSQRGHYLMYFDGNKILKVMNNLLSNALKFTPPGGKVQIALSREGDDVVLKISDNGIGLSKEDLPHIFDRFYQASDTKGGSGIGLHLVKEYINLHLGSVQVNNDPNFETVFTITLPIGLKPKQDIESEPTKSSEIDTVDSSVLQEFKLLVVEDNDELRHFLANELRKHYTVVEAEDGQIGLEKARSEMPDLMISDIMMPNMNGLDLCQKVKSELGTSHIPVILLTALASEGHRVSGYESGADEYLAKPFNMDILLLRISKLIEHRKLRQKHFSEKIEVNPSEITITSLDEELIQKLLALIEKNLANGEYSVQQLSNDLNMDRTVLYKKLLNITGLAPLEFMRSIRLKRAAQILVLGGYPVAEVAEMTGFNTQKYFAKYFKETFGCTPSKYAEQVGGRNKTY